MISGTGQWICMNLFLVSNFGPMFLLCTLQLFFARGFLTQREHQPNNTWQIVTGQLASLCDQRFVSVFLAILMSSQSTTNMF